MANIQDDDKNSGFYHKQSILIEVVGNNLKEMLDRITGMEGINYGAPPFILDDGEASLLLVDADGGYARLSPDYNLSEESVITDVDIIYSMPVRELGLIQFIPANPEFDFQLADRE
jgi:hypothetical protein